MSKTLLLKKILFVYLIVITLLTSTKTYCSIGETIDVKPTSKEVSYVGKTKHFPATNTYGTIGITSGKTIDNPADNYFTISLPNAISKNDKVWLVYELKGVKSATSVSRQINDRFTTGGMIVEKSKEWQLQKEAVSSHWFHKGKNTIQFSLPTNADYGYEVKNLEIVIEKTAKKESVVITDVKLIAGKNTLYIRGFLDVLHKGAVITIDGNKIDNILGEFEAIVPANSNILEVQYANGERVTKSLKLEAATIQPNYTYNLGKVYTATSTHFTQATKGSLVTPNAILEVSKGGLLATNKTFSITPLRSVDRVALDFGMTNTTKGAGYRFLPHGVHFKEKSALVKLKYDRTKIPNGYTEDDIRTYYFDQETGHWVALKRKEINKEEQYIISETTHFTDMINGVIKTPESPESNAYTPTTISGIKAADPSSKVNLIQPPSANSSGVASIGYPIELPAGRKGMQPSVGLQYNSDGGSGWLGEGWDISIPSITVETRWGVPRYKKDVETETYNLQGAMLAGVENGKSFVAHKGKEIARRKDRQFYKRLGGGFERIIRKGNSPANYYWIVTDKSGTKYYYGGVDGVNPNAVLRGKTANGEQNIAQWYLVRIEDTHGNTVNYTHKVQTYKVFGSLDAKIVYCTGINYTGYKSSEGPYKIHFKRKEFSKNIDIANSTIRKDVRTNAKYGFLTLVSADLLQKIAVTYYDEPVRSYELHYKEGAFYKKLLDKVVQLDADNKVFNSHTFDYYDEVSNGNNYKPFKSAENWTTGNDNIQGGLTGVAETADKVFTDDIPALGGGKTTSFGGSIYTGLGILASFADKFFTAGVSFGYSRSNSVGLIAMVDINGDGLPDKVVDEGGLFYRPNLSKPNHKGPVEFGEKLPIKGISDFSKTKTTSKNGGVKAYAIGSGGIDKNKSKTTTSVYFSDVNSDGLLDIVKGGTVYFNHVENYGTPQEKVVFSATSAGTPSPIQQGAKNIDASDTAVDPNEQIAFIKENPLQDVVRVWRAPYTGNITIQAPVKLVAPTGDYEKDEYEKSDGVRVAIQQNDNELWNTTIGKGNFSKQIPNITNKAVTKGDVIYFRVQSGAADNANGAFDKVIWNPIITYSNKPDITDYNGEKIYRFEASKSVNFSYDAPNIIPVNIERLDVIGKFVKPITTDDVRVKISDITTGKVYYEKVYAWNKEVNEAITLTDISFNKVASEKNEKNTKVKFEMVSETNIAWNQISWKPTLKIKRNGVFQEIPVLVDKHLLTKQVFAGRPYTVQNDKTKALTVVPAIDFTLNPNSLVLAGALTDPTIVMAIKKNKELVKKYTIKIAKIKEKLVITNFVAKELEGFKKGDVFWVEYSIKNPYLADLVKVTKANITEKELIAESPKTYKPINENPYIVDGRTFTINNAKVPLTLNNVLKKEFPKGIEQEFGSMYNHWGQFTYNAMEGRAQQPIKRKLLKLPNKKDYKPDPTKEVLGIMISNATQKYYRGNDVETYIYNDTISSSRLGEKDVILINPLAGKKGTIAPNVKGTGAIGIPKITRGKSNAKTFGVSGLFSVNASEAKGSSTVETDYRDMNGDGYPDIITRNKIQYTNSRGDFSKDILKNTEIHYSKNSSYSVGVGGSPVHSKSPTTSGSTNTNNSESGQKANDQAKNNNSVSGSAGDSSNKDHTEFTYMDVNGDGLPDKVIGNKVEINTGYSFLPPVEWANTSSGINFMYPSVGKSDSKNLGLGFDISASSFAGGVGVNRGRNTTTFSLMDINSDGLPDKVAKRGNDIIVQLNTGIGFEAPKSWLGVDKINESCSTGESANTAFTVNIAIPIPFAPLKLTINPSVNAAKSANRTLATLSDVNGDGYLDYVTSKNDANMTVKRSAIRNTNRLKTVTNPMGGQFNLAYGRSEATYDHPSGKWVLESVTVKDGIVDDGPDMKTVFEYKKGKYDRHERTFLGFGEVIAKSVDSQLVDNKTYYRSAIQEYDVSNYYQQGNLKTAVLKDGSDNLYTKKTNEYHHYTLVPNADNYSKTTNATPLENGISFSPLKYTKTESYEGTGAGITLQENSYEYGSYGEITSYKYADKGTLKSGQYNYETRIGYKNDISNYILSLPENVRVLGNGKVFRQTGASYDSKGNITEVRTNLTNSTKAVVNLKYDRYGNITKRTMPANHKGERMFYEYKYEGDLHTYVERIEDAFGYHTRFEKYDYRFGQVLESEDINGFFINYELDAKGRITKVTGPNEHEQGVDYTIKFAYSPLAKLNSQGEMTQVPYAITKHYDPQHKGDDLETVTFMDGMARAIQVKKEGVLTLPNKDGGTPKDEEVFIVSGRVKYDAFGRAVKSYYPITESKGSKIIFNKKYDNVSPTQTSYDVQDRALHTILPDGSKTSMAYTTDSSTNTLRTTVTDAEGNSKTSYTNGSGLTIKVQEEEGIETNYEYDPINQLLKVIDANQNIISSTYDLAGRRTSVTHPDAGVTRFVYDNASNMLSKQTANLKKVNKKITYEYDYGRLEKINYPIHPENNVRYYYGKRNASHNRVGRLVLQEDGTGAQEFFYGKLGEITKVKRTVVIPNNAVATFQTEWKYDSWNRLQEMIYPDKEKVVYSYNKGGLLEKVTGKKTFDYNYVKKLGYDKFEQRTYLQYCNGAETVYEYDPARRRLENLKSWTGKGYKGGGSRQQFMNNQYKYDKVNNVLSVQNLAPLPTGEKAMGGQMQHKYTYDNLYRLTDANGTYTGSNKKTAQYSLSMQYDKLHNITSKEQHIQQQGVTFKGTLKAGYKLDYSYGKNPHQIATIKDENYRTEEEAVNKPVYTENVYEYDANGNLFFVSKNQAKEKQNERKLLWDEENRLEAVSDNGYVSLYTYDASGERVTKLSGNGESVYVNSQDAGKRTQTDKYTAYISPYFVLSSGGQYTKHIMVGSQRIVSKLGDVGSFGQDPRRIEYAGKTEGIQLDYKAKYEKSQETIKGRYKRLEVVYNGKDNDDYRGGESFCCGKTKSKEGRGIIKEDKPELYQYYYHPDHLGSSSYITDLDGGVVQHIEYVPFGEVFINEMNNVWNTPYKFNGKELDEETGLYYYGARYYNPRTSQWLSVDPLALFDPVMEVEHYLNGEHNNGVYNPKNLSVYGYTYQNPVRYSDPNGKQTDEVQQNYIDPIIIDVKPKPVQPKPTPAAKPTIGGGVRTFVRTALKRLNLIGALLTSQSLNGGEEKWVEEQNKKRYGVDETIRLKDLILKSEDQRQEESPIYRIEGADFPEGSDNRKVIPGKKKGNFNDALKDFYNVEGLKNIKKISTNYGDGFSGEYDGGTVSVRPGRKGNTDSRGVSSGGGSVLQFNPNEGNPVKIEYNE